MLGSHSHMPGTHRVPAVSSERLMLPLLLTGSSFPVAPFSLLFEEQSLYHREIHSRNGRVRQRN
uniref:Uncharacterized protein n=1 Tax=Anguilla anguilla TaxID=7936 RepID=A0A0E9WT42_ANGAN